MRGILCWEIDSSVNYFSELQRLHESQIEDLNQAHKQEVEDLKAQHAIEIKKLLVCAHSTLPTNILYRGHVESNNVYYKHVMYSGGFQWEGDNQVVIQISKESDNIFLWKKCFIQFFPHYNACHTKPNAKAQI